MAKKHELKTAKEKLEAYRIEFDVAQKDGVAALTTEEKAEYLLYQQLSFLKNIGYYLQFFVVITIIGLIIGGIFVLSAIFL